MTGKQARNSFNSSAFLTAKVKDADERLITLREQVSAAQAERAQLDATVKELNDAIKVTEADRVNYERTLAELTLAGGRSGSKTAEAPELNDLTDQQGTENAEPVRKTVADKILGVLSENPRAEWTVKELESQLPEVNAKVLSNTTLRLHNKGQIARVRQGVYRVS